MQLRKPTPAPAAILQLARMFNHVTLMAKVHNRARKVKRLQVCLKEYDPSSESLSVLAWAVRGQGLVATPDNTKKSLTITW